MRPLDRVGSLKVKLGVVIVAAVLVTIAVVELGRWAGWAPPLVAIAALAIAIAMVQVLAHGMTFPLRQMARAASQLAAGERYEPVVETSHDEVGDLARAFNRMASEVAETDRLRQELVANVSHELRTPVAALRAVLENLADGVEQPDPPTLERLVRQTDRLQTLVEALLDLSRLEAGVLHLDVAEVDVQDLCEEAVSLVAVTPGAPVRLRMEPGGLRLAGDGRRLLQVLVNLLVNARAHAPAGSEVTLTAGAVDGGVELAVVDDGPGVAPEDRDRIFERFHRSAGRAGTGLGLAISRWIVGLHDGRIEVDAGHRPGCRMVVRLPMTKEP